MNTRPYRDQIRTATAEDTQQIALLEIVSFTEIFPNPQVEGIWFSLSKKLVSFIQFNLVNKSSIEQHQRSFFFITYVFGDAQRQVKTILRKLKAFVVKIDGTTQAHRCYS
ncbi:hypothetical protein FE904_02385 [Chryseobacterium indologenes]|uniref:hypothetical protein n=1 Tax=Chryseobacterium indologenes TaxID=253 RepID=UPI001109BFA6|nr:hypothetical protein [Chryseobacterium indologenes]TLX27256.1 hypothetical protein FE904_02385 [Chryseobacterium indologenes]